MTGAADMAVTVLFAGIGLYATWKVLLWLADRFMDAIDWMTQLESKR